MAFSYCSSLETVELNEGLQTIERNAFSYCRLLKNIAIPNSVMTINDTAFACEIKGKSRRFFGGKLH